MGPQRRISCSQICLFICETEVKAANTEAVVDKLLLDIDQLQKQIVPLKAALKDASSKTAVENMSKELEEHMANCVVKKVSN